MAFAMTGLGCFTKKKRLSGSSSMSAMPAGLKMLMAWFLLLKATCEGLASNTTS
jgi:hypothetical protein